jgi:hypothetical protein
MKADGRHTHIEREDVVCSPLPAGAVTRDGAKQAKDVVERKQGERWL